MENLLLIAQVTDDISNTYLIKGLMAVIFGIGGFAAAPIIFMATMGIFRNITGMSSGLSKGLRGKMMAKGSAGRERGMQSWKADKNAHKELVSQNRSARFAQRRRGLTANQRANRDAFNDASSMTRSDELMKSRGWQGHMFKDDVMKALTYNNETEARAAGITDTSTLQAASQIGYGRASQVAAAKQLAANKTGYGSAADAMDTIRRVSGGNKSMEDSLRENVKYISKGVGRNDLGALRTINQGETRDQWNNNMTSAGFENLDTYSLGREHANSYLNMAAAHSAQYQEAVQAHQTAPTAATREAVVEARTKLEETVKNASSATGTNSRVATRAADYISTIDQQLRSSEPDGGVSILGAPSTPRPDQGDAQGDLGEGGLARARRAMSDEERKRYDESREKKT